MTSSSWSAFAKTVLLPMLIALGIYVLVFLVLLPVYRRQRLNLARYSNYSPLSSSLAQQTTSLFEPYLIEPSKTLVQKLKDRIVKGIRWVLVHKGRAWDSSITRELRPFGSHAENEDEEDEDYGGLFDAESGEAMVGFDFQQRTGRGRGRQRAHEHDRDDVDADDSNRRLSRELEEGFRDDSGSEASDEEVTAGRRTANRRGSEVRT